MSAGCGSNARGAHRFVRHTTQTTTAPASPLTVGSLTRPQTRWRRLYAELASSGTPFGRAVRSSTKYGTDKQALGKSLYRALVSSENVETHWHEVAESPSLFAVSTVRGSEGQKDRNGCFAATYTTVQGETRGSKAGIRTPVRCLSPMRLSRVAPSGTCGSCFQRSGTDGW